MLLEIDRIQLAVPDVAPVVERWQSILGAEISTVDEVACLGASRTSLRLGTGLIEVLEPDGSGVVADAVAKRGAHMFAAGASCVDVEQVQKSLAASNIVREGGQLFIDGEDIGIKGLRVVVSKHIEPGLVKLTSCTKQHCWRRTQSMKPLNLPKSFPWMRRSLWLLIPPILAIPVP